MKEDVGDKTKQPIQVHLAYCGFDTVPEFIAAVGQNLGKPDELIARCQRIYQKSNGNLGLLPPFVTDWLKSHTPNQTVRKLRKRHPKQQIVYYTLRPPEGQAAA